MKKLILFIFVSLVLIKTNAQTNAVCCPEKFELKQLINDRQCDLLCDSSFRELGSAVGVPNNPTPGQKPAIVACKNSQMQYLVIPNLPGFTYNWVVTGGTVAPNPGNPVTISWGNVNKGSIVVTISNADGSCVRKIAYDICLLDKPVANFSFSPSSPICVNNLVQFNNTSLGGATYFWDFGDGTTSTDVNPQHTYTTVNNSPGYIVTLVVKSKSNGCGCVDSIKQTIVVNDGPGISGCDKMLCPGDTATYCSTKTCGSYSWSVNGGTIIGSSTGNCVRVAWNVSQPGTLPATITLNTTGCGACSTTTLPVNIVWPAIPIQGNTLVCVGSTETYSLPVMPGTFYSWTLSGGGNIVNSGMYPNAFPNNNPQINIDWTTPGTYNLTVNYTNPNTKKKCGGSYTLSITVKPKFKIMGMTSVCAGTTGMYMTQDFSLADWTVTGGVLGTDYTFSTGPNGVSNFQVNWITSGVYQLCGQPIAANAANYCNTNPVCISVIVKPTPVVTVGGSNLVCPGVLTNYVASSTPPGGNFVWSVSPTLAQLPAPYGTYDENASIIFNGTAPWTVTAQTILNGCVGQAAMVVNQVPAPTLPATPLTACIGGQVTISVASGTGPFTWSTSPAASLISGQGTGTATYELHGSGTITVSNCGGTSNAVTVTATLPPTITITTTGSLCAGTLQLSASAGGTYQWSGGSVATTQTINVSIPGSYTVQVTFPGGCKSVATHVVAPVPIPTVTISTGDPLVWCLPLTPNVNFTAFTLGSGCSYQWYRNGSPFGTNSPTLNTTLAGSYYVVVTCGGCVATSNTINVVQQNCTPVPGCASPIPPSPFGTIVITGCNPKTFTISGLNACPGGVVDWTFGDGGTATGTTVTHTYLNTGTYGVTASMTCNGCKFTIISTAQVPVKADFNYSVACGLNGSNTITMNNTSQVLGGWAVTSVGWSSTCGTPPTGTGSTYTLNTTIGCSPTVTMTVTVTNTATGQVCTDVKTVPFTFASSPLTISGPTTVCKDQTYSFSSSMTGILYQWTVNGAPVSQNAVLSYAFNGTPVNPVVGLTVTDAFGCTFNTSVTLNVVTAPALSITPSPIIKVCQAPCLTTGSVLTATPGFTNYEWFQNGASLGAPSGSNTYTVTGPSPIGTYYVQAQSLPNLCNVKSNTVSVVYHPKPQAKIIANSVNCITSVPFNLTSAPSNPSVSANASFTAGYNYEWFLNGLGTPIYNSNSTNYLTYTINSFGTYTFIVRVTDVATGCCNLDTICIAFSKNPTVNIVPGGPLCQGVPVTLTATAGPAAPASYYYAWENGQTGQTHVVQAAGMYGVMAMDNYGCSAAAFVTIKPLPYVALFPQGCDTICLGDTNKLQFPLPTNISGQPSYTIVWSLPGGVGTIFPLSGLALGSHTITATVTMNGCTATTAAYNVFVKNCDTCNCDESYWKDGPLLTNVTTGEKTKIECTKQPFTYIIQGDHCKDSLVLSGLYICKGKDCPGKVVFSLYDANTNNYIGGGSGSYAIPSALPNGSYYVTIYAYCGDIICDSCKINIKKDCEKGCDCNKPEAQIRPVLTINNVQKPIKCGDAFKVNCLSNVTLNANYFCIPQNCPATVTYQLTGPISQTGTLPLSLSGLPAGSYSIIIMAYCGGKLCKECKLNFEVVCEKDCCPYDIKATLQNQTTTLSPGGTNLLVNQGFNFTGLTGASLTEIRAEVLSYNLTSQFPEQCIGCKNLPKGWASIYDGNVMGPVVPKVNLAGVMTNAPLNVGSLSAYSNPREIVWNNGGSIFSIVQPVALGFILPKPSPLDCCDATAEICVKFTFRDKDCNECEVIICFKAVIKKK